ncbi:hypothetical protein RVR_9821 [Actinacidiphila reveromycinica]|uniref:Uncharacterized protein n=1 Tax=Actinacidiphila reveromycinica TaxID=659352 RepID=A0A7U3V0C5_9ACTN|nr:hypothetical protein RVR_9821 [Streptomyces sp. SN-593]
MPAPAVRVVEQVGAGGAFAAGFSAGLHRGARSPAPCGWTTSPRAPGSR